MKKRYTIISILLFLLFSLHQVFAFEFPAELTFRQKLKRDATIFNVVTDTSTGQVVSCVPVGTLQAGTFVNATSYIPEYSIGKICYYADGVEHVCWVEHDAIVNAERILWFTDGTYASVSEALTRDMTALYDWISRMTPGHTLYAISTTDQGNPLYYDYDPAKVRIIGSKPEATKAPATEAPVPVVTPIPNSGETPAPGTVTTTPKPNTTRKPNATSGVKHTAAPTRVPTAEDYTLKQLGTVTSLVAWQGKSFEIATTELFTASTVPPEQQLAIIYAPKEGSAALRRSASTSAYLTRHCKAGYLVKVLEYGKKFCKVIYDGDTGYVLTSSLRFITPGTEPDARALISVNGRTNGATYVNVRCAPDKNSAKVAEWDTGTEVLIYGEQNGWYQIEARGRRGWVLEKFLTVTE